MSESRRHMFTMESLSNKGYLLWRPVVSPGHRAWLSLAWAERCLPCGFIFAHFLFGMARPSWPCVAAARAVERLQRERVAIVTGPSAHWLARRGDPSCFRLRLGRFPLGESRGNSLPLHC